MAKNFLCRRLLLTSGYIEVKQRAGCLSYMEDKLGYQSQLARTLTQSEVIPWDPPAKTIISFSSEATLRYFCDNYLAAGNQTSDVNESKLRHVLTRTTYDCVIKDKLFAILIVTTLVKVWFKNTVFSEFYTILNFRLLGISEHHQVHCSCGSSN